MANSRKRLPSPEPVKRIAIALSGGLDSVVLLDTICKNPQFASAVEIWVFHIHHGLQKPADRWLEFCLKLAKKYRVHFDFRLLYLDPDLGNVESRARAARYEALAELCEEHHIQDLLLAHHLNDQAETVLLQLLRGAGVAGLSAMPAQRPLKANQYQTNVLRPILDQSRSELEAYAKKHRLKWIEDPSNRDMSYRRNAIRKKVIPRLMEIQPEALSNIARSATLLAEAQTLLDRLAQLDGKSILQKGALQLEPLLSLRKHDVAAANNLLRYWLKTHQLAMPSQERLESWWQDLLKVGHDAQLEWIHDETQICLWRGLLQVIHPQAGEWVFKLIPQSGKKLGLPADWLAECKERGLITQRERVGSEKIQIAAKSPRKSLKNLYQECAVPPWQRHLPLLYVGGDLLAVAYVGVSYPHLVSAGKRWIPVWQAENT
jgi:tRNA(Ile)-lysidine synthase